MIHTQKFAAVFLIIIGGIVITRREIVRTGMLAATGTFLQPAIPAVAKSANADPSTPSTPDISAVGAKGAWVCWVGHSTVLINLFGSWILTDPVLFDNFGLRILGLTIGPRRYVQPALRVEDIPKPDIVLLSHAHIDHMDIRTLQAIAERFPNSVDVITATNTSDVIQDMPWGSLNEMDWGDRVEMHGTTLRALQVVHNGHRLPGEPCRAAGQRRTGRSYNGYLIENNGLRIVFGGDTAYTQTFANIGGSVDVAIMPIGAYEGYLEDHCTPEEALAMAEMMKARHVVPIHHATFRMSPEPRLEPITRLRRAARYSKTQLAMQDVGGVLSIDVT